MEESNKKENGNGEAPATQPQKELIYQLLDECGITGEARTNWDNPPNKAKASAYVQSLKDMKISLQRAKAEEQRVNGFDKISFGMVYKLCWNYHAQEAKPFIGMAWGFNHWVFLEYQSFKKAVDYCKQKVQEGGQQ